jgi:predicted unusual protein kinase regulating ubiquinone biosynthesis (AarF/ABC1/UbiB family)
LIEPRRYRRLVRFFAGVLVHALWWDVLLDRPLLRLLRPDATRRWTRIARAYRELAVSLGGVLIKLGQFLSTRVDVLPTAITEVLSGLQDEVPPVAFERIERAIENDFARPLDSLFTAIEASPLGAASLAQVHAARLLSGEAVVVKVLRPGIEQLVETDLAAVGVAVRWLRRYRPIARRVDVDALVDEFTRTTRAELDLEQERANIERFAAQFAANPAVIVPRTYPQASSRRTLALENVAAIKISDIAALDAAGVDRPALARSLFRCYLEQIFDHRFVHADPHPGNLFVWPASAPGRAAQRRGPAGDLGTESAGRPAAVDAVAFVDFGMMATVPARLEGALRELVQGFAARDPRRMVRAYAAAGALLPGADLGRLEEVHRALFQRFWGVPIGSLRDHALDAAPELLREFFDVVRAAPFQLQVDLLFTLRALELLFGLTTTLDPKFDPWREVMDFARRLDRPSGTSEVVDRALASGGRILALPLRLDALLDRIEDGGVRIQTGLDVPVRRQLAALTAAIDRLAWFALAVGAGLAGGMLYEKVPGLATPLLAIAALAIGLGLLRRWRPPAP